MGQREPVGEGTVGVVEQEISISPVGLIRIMERRLHKLVAVLARLEPQV